jgi:hypothetical protein
MSKPSKTIIALMCKNAQERNHLKSILIRGDLAETAAQKQALKSKGSKGKDTE